MKGLSSDFFKNVFSYVDTPYGQVKVYETGPTNGMKVILVHGITTPTPVFKEVVEKLVQAGFRVMLYDLYGRGRSDSVQMPHDVPLFIAQLAFVLAAKPDWTKFSVAGMSFGGPIGEFGFSLRSWSSGPLNDSISNLY